MQKVYRGGEKILIKGANLISKVAKINDRFKQNMFQKQQRLN